MNDQEKPDQATYSTTKDHEGRWFVRRGARIIARCNGEDDATLVRDALRSMSSGDLGEKFTDVEIVSEANSLAQSVLSEIRIAALQVLATMRMVDEIKFHRQKMRGTFR